MRSYASPRPTTAQRSLTLLAAASLLLLVLSGQFDTPAPKSSVLLLIVGGFLAWMGWEFYRGAVRFWRERSDDPSYEAWHSLGFVLLGGTMILLRLTGGLYSPFYPLFYLTVAFLASFGTSSQGALWFAYAILLECAALLAGGATQSADIGRAILHLLYLSLFALSHHLYLHSLLWSVQRQRSTLRKQRHETRPPSLHASHSSQEIYPASLTSSLPTLAHLDHRTLLVMLHEGFDAHGCALLWLDEQQKTYTLTEIYTNTPQIDEGPFLVSLGTLAGLFTHQHNINSHRNGENSLLLPYYNPRHTVIRSILAVPIRQEEQIRGAICIDRIHAQPFSSREETTLEAIALLFASALQRDSSFRRADRDLQHLHLLHDIGQRLNQATNEHTLASQVLDAASEITPFQWGFVSYLDQAQAAHIPLATTENISFLRDAVLPLEGSLLALALKHRCPLPEAGHLRSEGPYLATEEPTGLPSIESLYLLPLLLRDEAIGVIALGSQHLDAFASPEIEQRLGMLANQVAPLLSHLRHVTRIEYLAVRDGLTGLYNHRSFMERAYTAFQAARRHQRALSVLMLDLDHFKQINDTYGHLIGDEVLFEFGNAITEIVRETDTAARYSGEKFAILLEETDTSGALRLADRLRQHIASLRFSPDETEENAFHLTLSVGIASFPEHASDLSALLQAADDALRLAKDNGRNRIQIVSPPLPPPSPEDDLPFAIPIPQSRWGWGSLPPEADPSSFDDTARWACFQTPSPDTPSPTSRLAAPESYPLLPLHTPAPDLDPESPAPPSSPSLAPPLNEPHRK